MIIKEVSKATGLTADTLRYYERIGLLPHVKRTAAGIRQYDETDIGWIEFIKCMRGAGLPIEVLIDYVGLFQEGETTRQARKEILVEQREQLAERIKDLEQVLAKLDMKIANYDSIVYEAEKRLQNK